MRKILFRGKSVTNGRWRKGDLLRANGEKFVVGTSSWGVVNPDTIGQYTGIDDKNGVKVFEGDIIRAIAEGEEDTYMVEWCGDRNYPAFDLKPQIDCDSNGLSHIINVGAEIEVIGNKFDNPELLEE